MNKLLVNALLVAAMMLVSSIMTPECAAQAACPPPSNEWSELEKTVWQTKICGGRPVNLYEAKPGEARLSAHFLQDILGQDPWREVTGRNGLQIHGAVFPQRVLLQRFAIDRDLWLESCIFEKGMTISEVEIKGSLSLYRSRFDAGPDGEARKPTDLLLANVRIHNNLYLNDLLVGKIQLLSCQIEGNLFAIRKDAGWNDAHAARLYLQGTKIDSEIVIESQAIDALVLNETVVGRGMKISQATQQPAPRVQKIELTGVKVENGVHLDSVESDSLRIDLSTIGGSLDVGGGRFSEMSLRSSSIGGWLRLHSDRMNVPLQWVDGGHLDLMDVKVRVIATADLWPASIRAEDFHLDRVEETASTQTAETTGQPLRPCGEKADGETDSIIRWLSRSCTDPVVLEPYYVLADLVRKKGEADRADAILIAGWDQKRAHAPWLEWTWLTMKRVIIGYGYRPTRAIIGVVVLVLLGTGVLRLSPEARKQGFGFWCSLDLLLPFVTLRDAHHKAELEPGIRHYFYIHQLMGWALASFLVAGLSGLVK